MPEVREVLERARDRLAPPGLDAFERLIVFRARRRSRQRFEAGLIAFAVAIAATTFLVQAFHEGRSPGTEPSLPPPSPAAFDPHAVATFPVGNHGETNAILQADGNVWVTGYNVEGGGGVDRAGLFRIDPATLQVIDMFPLDTAPTGETGGRGVAFANGSIWVTGGGKLPDDSTQAVLDRVDPSTGEVLAEIPLGGRFGADISVNAEGVWVGIFTAGNAELVKVDPATDEVVSRTQLPSSYVRQVATSDDSVVLEELEWADGEGPCGYLTRIDPVTAEITRRDAVGDPCGLTSLITWNGELWSTLDGRFAPLDPLTLKPASQGFPFEDYHLPRGFLVPDATGIWYAAYPGGDGNAPDRLTRMDPTTGEIQGYPLTLDHGAIAATIVDASLFALNFDGTVTRIDLLADATTPATPIEPCLGSGSFGETLLGRWLRQLLLDVGGPGALELTADDIVERDFAYWLQPADYEGRFELNAFAEPPDVENVDLGVLPKVAVSDDYTLYGDVPGTPDFDQFIVAGSDVWITIHVIPESETISLGSVTAWFDRIEAELAARPAPPCQP